MCLYILIYICEKTVKTIKVYFIGYCLWSAIYSFLANIVEHKLSQNYVKQTVPVIFYVGFLFYDHALQNLAQDLMYKIINSLI